MNLFAMHSEDTNLDMKAWQRDYLKVRKEEIEISREIKPVCNAVRGYQLRHRGLAEGLSHGKRGGGREKYNLFAMRSGD